MHTTHEHAHTPHAPLTCVLACSRALPLAACLRPRCCQVIDLISLKPFDMETISSSIKKTRKALIVEECMKTGGIGASLSAVINESLFDELDHQVSTAAGCCGWGCACVVRVLCGMCCRRPSWTTRWGGAAACCACALACAPWRADG